ncbi:MAG: N-acetylmuramic acid 6-phosphate etherase [Caldilineaceae bacterium]|nr:N-acetylmuramic acid 6-phosphate etherase [Caldilineaceae bacterium]
MSNQAQLTETRNPASAEIDLVSTLELVRIINTEDAKVPFAVGAEATKIAAAIDGIVARMRQGGRLIYVGAGTSGRLGVLDASECPPTYSAPRSLVVGLIAGGQTALTNSIEGAEDRPEDGADDVAALNVDAIDTVVGIAASGRTPYTIGAMEEAKRRGALVVSVTCNAGSPMAAVADIAIEPLVGPEVVTGSTRMKAGTAQKLVLNLLSTGAMIRLGKTFGNLMVDVQPSNTKLKDRARRIVAEATGLNLEAAAVALDAAGGEVKPAILAQLLGVSPAEARERLDAAGGVIRRAVAANDEGARDNGEAGA